MSKKQWYIENLEGKIADIRFSPRKTEYSVEFLSVDAHWEGGDNTDFQTKLVVDLSNGKNLEANIERVKELFEKGKLVVTGSANFEILLGKWAI